MRIGTLAEVRRPARPGMLVSGGVQSIEEQLIAFFASGVKGAWYERSRAVTRYQESIGITLASAAGNPVGLGLSLDQGGGRGTAENVSNPGPAFAAATGWVSNGTLSVVGGKLRCTATGAGTFRSTISPAAVAQKTYEGRVSISGTVPTQVGAWQFSSTAGPLAVVAASPAARVDSFILAPATLPYYIGAMATAASAGDYFEIDFVTVREVPGNHQRQATASLRPLYQAGPPRLVFDGVDDVLNTTFAAALGANCTVGRAIPGTGAVIATSVNIGTTFADNVTASALLIADRALTVGETALWTAYLNQQSTL